MDLDDAGSRFRFRILIINQRHAATVLNE